MLGLWQSIKNLFWKGGKTLGVLNTLSQITDDPRIATDENEVARIKLAQRYYAGNYFYKSGLPINTVEYFNSQNVAKRRPFNIINTTQMCAQRLASICLNSGFDVSLAAKNAQDDGNGNDSQVQQVSNWITNWLEQSGVNRNLEEKLQQGIPAGGFAARPYVDNDKIKVAWVRANQFFSLDSNTEEVSQAAIASRSVKVINAVRYYYTLLEFHQWVDSTDSNGNTIKAYQITNELYKTNNVDEVGAQVPLGTDDMYSGVAPSVVISDFKRPLFAYFRCPGDNNIDPESPLGIGFVNNTQNILDAINYVHDSFLWETRMGRRKVLVPPEMVKPPENDEVHTASQFDPDQDVIMGVQGLDSDTTSNPVVQINPDIRVQEYQQVMEFYLHELENAVGLSTGTFSTDAQGGITTATQVVSENSMTYQTRSTYLNRVSKFLSDLIKSVIELAQEPQMFTDGKTPLSGVDIENIKVNVHYDDGVFVDKDKQATQDMQAVMQNAMPRVQFLMRNYGLSESDAKEWIAEVEKEAPEQPSDEDGQESDLLNGGDE